MTISYPDYTAALDPQTLAIRAFHAYGVACFQGNVPAFVIRLQSPEGRLILIDSGDATRCLCAYEAETARREFGGFAGFPGLAVTLCCRANARGLAYTIRIENGTDHYVENIAYPIVSVPDALTENGGKGHVFWPWSEGTLIEDAEKCRHSAVRDTSHASLSATRTLHYPGMVMMQYMAYYAEGAGMYVGAHDPSGMPKTIAPYRMPEGIRLDIRPFPCVAPGETYESGYPTVLRPFRGDWQDATLLYREFIEEGSFPLPPKANENTSIPAFLRESPVVTIYPPRSVRGSGYMGPNEFFPYVNAIKYLEELGEAVDSKILSFLAYWEGSAPWAAPFTWPPYGGEEHFMAYVREMHARGYYVGAYASGLNWTDQHLLCPEYDKTRYRREQGLTGAMCEYPDGSLIPGICRTIRTGHMMCAAVPATREIAYQEMRHILEADMDFIQYFDQHMGGEAYSCYSNRHGHPPCYGAWAVEAMREIYDHFREMIAEAGNRCALGTESAPGDFYLRDFTFSDLRWHQAMAFGAPVPAYNLLFHEYAVNFMGNQCGVDSFIARDENPDSLLYAFAYSFTAGDLLTVVMKSGGEIHYDWGLSWLHPGPKQAPVKKLVRNLNAMRKGAGAKWLYGGRMEKTPPFAQPGAFVMTRRDGTTLTVPEVLSSLFVSPDGAACQFFANHRHHDVEIALEHAPLSVFDAAGRTWRTSGNKVVVPALDCLGVRIEP